MTDGTFSSLPDALQELKRTKNLTKVSLTNVDVRDAGLSDLLFGLRKQTTLKEIALANCGLGKCSAGHLVTFLKYNKTVTRLYLQHNQKIGDEGVMELTKAFKSNKTLQVLNLANCDVGDIGASAIAEDLGSVKKLYLYNNRIGSIGAEAMANLIKGNSLFAELFIWDNPLTNAGLEILKEARDEVWKKAEESSQLGPRLNLVVGLRSEKVAKNSAPAVKRNFVVPKDRENKAVVDTSKPGLFGDLRAKANSLVDIPDKPSLDSLPGSTRKIKVPDVSPNTPCAEAIMLRKNSTPIQRERQELGNTIETKPLKVGRRNAMQAEIKKKEHVGTLIRTNENNSPIRGQCGASKSKFVSPKSVAAYQPDAEKRTSWNLSGSDEGQRNSLNSKPAIKECTPEDDEIARLQAEIAMLEQQIKSASA